VSSGFYGSYGAYKDYQTPGLSKKDIARFDEEIWGPAGFTPAMSCLEIGCGTGQFLLYLQRKGLDDLAGVDLDPNLEAVLPSEIKDRVTFGDVRDFLAARPDQRFDRIVLLDVLEHFPPEEGARLLGGLKTRLCPGGRVLVKVPNAASPWGLNFQHGDLTHMTAYNALSLRQLAAQAGMRLEKVYDQQRGTRRRKFTDSLVNGFLKWALVAPPDFFGINLYALFKAED
jgi:cyclopropane fatty-acyl-phospholipid synthase-like methyltransferase